MQTSLQHLPVSALEELDLALLMIRIQAAPEKVFLLSMPESYQTNDTKTGPSPYLERLNFLIVLSKAHNHQRQELQEQLESSCLKQGIRINALIHTAEQLNCMYQENPYIFPELQQEGRLLYDSGTSSIPLPSSSPQGSSQLASQHFNRWFMPACAFCRSARFNLFRRELSLTAFLLHQSLEHAYTAIHLVFTGYRPTTHNLDKMRRYTSRFSAALAGVFPRHNEEENHLFYLLKTAYSRARYANDYAISEKECFILLSRVSRLLLIARCICRKHIIFLHKEESSPIQ